MAEQFSEAVMAVGEAQLRPETLWAGAIELIRARVNEFVLNAFFKPLRAGGIVDGQLVLEIHDQFTKDWILDHYRFVIDEVLVELNAQKGGMSPRGLVLNVNSALAAPS